MAPTLETPGPVVNRHLATPGGRRGISQFRDLRQPSSLRTIRSTISWVPGVESWIGTMISSEVTGDASPGAGGEVPCVALAVAEAAGRAEPAAGDVHPERGGVATSPAGPALFDR